MLQKKLGDSFTRLSSGLRINKSSDDAAGLSISESLKSDTRLFNQGIRNLNDGLSVLNIADGALGELSNITIRLRELATQSSNGTFSNKQRLALDQEAQSLAKEYNRIARTTEFNGRKIFNGDYGDLSLAAGGGAESLIVNGLGGGIGDGSFYGGTSFATGSAPFSVTVGDFNGDGVSDLVSADQGSSSLSVFLGNGDGSFSQRTTFVAGASTYSVSIGDFNGDGVSDLVSSDWAASKISIFLGNGDGSFYQRTTFVAGLLPRSVRVGDFNGDGVSDVVTGDVGGTVSVFLGNGDGSFSGANSFDGGASIYAVNIADFNRDGVFDLVSANYAAGTVSVLLGNGNGSFSGGTSFATGANLYSVSIGDFNGDNISDLVYGGGNSHSVNVLLGNGNGTFSGRTSFVAGSGPVSVSIGDFNGDGVTDLVSGYDSLNSLSIFIGNSNSGVSALQSFSLKTKQDAKNAMDYLSGALTRISKQRGEIGAFQSRVEVATSTLQTGALSYQEANSRITDIDVAEESSRLAATQILQQSASSILAQANLQPQLVLNLLRDL